MKQYVVLLAVLASTIMPIAAQAQAYVSTDTGVSHLGIDCNGLSSCSQNGTAYKIIAGYKLESGLAGELGYSDFGRAIGTDRDIPDVFAKFTAKAWTLGIAYELPIAAELHGTARVGIASMTSTAAADINLLGVVTTSTSETKTESYYGLGANYGFGRHIKVEAGVDWSHAEIQGSIAVVRSMTAGVRYQF